LARSRLRSLPPQREDPEDVANSVLKSFFLRCRDDEFDLTGWDSLWGLLARITLRKCGHRIEYHRAARRDVQRERAGPGNSEAEEVGLQAVSREPTPLEAAVAVETVEHLMAAFEPRDREILTMALQGYSSPEISSQAGCTERTVRRVMERIRSRLDAMRNDSGESREDEPPTNGS
jgi:RNA polymerase sigma-70 factor (ECF subfamily)